MTVRDEVFDRFLPSHIPDHVSKFKVNKSPTKASRLSDSLCFTIQGQTQIVVSPQLRQNETCYSLSSQWPVVTYYQVLTS